MRHEREFHYLVRLIYQPRVLIYGLSVVITLSRAYYGEHSLAVAALCLVLLVYPHLAFLVTGWSGTPARYSLLADGILVGMLIVANEFHLMASTSFLTALVISTLVVAGPLILSINVLIVVIIVGLGFYNLGTHLWHGHQPLTDALSAFALILYSGLVGHIGFNETVALIDGRSRMNEQHHRLAGMTDRLSRYVSPQIYSSLAHSDPGIPARRKRLTVFFSDIEGFTRLMDRLDEETVTRLLNEYLNDMAAIALSHGGTVDKFMGDGVMVFFGDPVSRGVTADALACVRMAIAMRGRLKRLREKWREDLHIRIGIHTGYCAVGNFGSEHRMDYTIIGGAVNLASRLETHAGRDEILISRATCALVARHVTCLPGSPIMVKGIGQPVEVYSVKCEPAREGGEPVIRLLRSG